MAVYKKKILCSKKKFPLFLQQLKEGKKIERTLPNGGMQVIADKGKIYFGDYSVSLFIYDDNIWMSLNIMTEKDWNNVREHKKSQQENQEELVNEIQF